MDATSRDLDGLTEAQRRALLDLVERHLASQGRTFAVGEDGRYHVDGNVLRLAALARECAALAPDAWPDHVAAALDAVVGEATRAEAEEILADAERACGLLRPKLWPESALGAVARGQLSTVLRPLVPGLAMGLALQLRDAVVSPTGEDVDRWGHDRDALFARAVANLQADAKLAVTPEPFLPDCDERVLTIFEGSYFLTSHLLRLGDYLPPSATAGALVVVPHTGALAFYPVGSHTLEAATRLRRFAARTVARAPRPLSAALYWWRDDALEEVELLERTDGPVLRGSPELVEALATRGIAAETLDPLARQAREVCLAMIATSGGDLIELFPAAGAELPFDPELGHRGASYFVVETPEGSIVDVFGEMVFPSLEELVAATFVDEVALRRA